MVLQFTQVRLWAVCRIYLQVLQFLVSCRFCQFRIGESVKEAITLYQIPYRTVSSDKVKVPEIWHQLYTYSSQHTNLG